MGKKSNKSKMRKVNSFIFWCFALLITLSGCGMPGPLYQKQDTPPVENNEQTTSNTQAQEK